jgi:cobalt-zinc-cadmium efflux system outer membrane protein
VLIQHYLAVALLATALIGCSTPGKDYRRLSAAMEQRTGATIGAGEPGKLVLPPGVSLEGGLSEDKAAAIALWNNAAFQENLSKLGFARADLAQAGQLSNPSLSMLFPWGPKQLEFAATFPLEAVWLRPRRVKIARLDTERVAEGLVQSGLDLVRDVRVTFSDLELARDRARLAGDAIQLRERIAAITEGRFRGGEASELESSAVQTEVIRARDDARRAEHDASIAAQRLLALTGLSGVTNVTVLPRHASELPSVPLAQLEQQALVARPDLRAAEIAMEAAGKRAGLAKAEIFALSGIIDANAQGKKGFEIGPGVQLPIPILNQNQGGRARAAAELDRAAWACAGVRQRIVAEVREAHVKYTQAAEALETWTRELLPALEDLVRRSEKAYELGELSPLAVQENARQLLAARLRHAELRADLRRARAELERSVGTRRVPESNSK